ncbi:MAG: CCA tRNA nucleotidyltransferase [Cyanobacteria bacterium P01_H01_bin.121]
MPPLLPQSSILLPQQWPFDLALLPKPAYLVGGIVRDAFLGRRGDYLDLDFVLPKQAIEAARRIAYHCNAGFVVLDAQRQIARVVFDNATVDFALQEGDSLDADLRRRDFTVNAIAYNPHTQDLVDPLGGYQDLQQRQLRMVSVANLQDDPLRLLRAFRQAAQLNFRVDPETHATIAHLATSLAHVAAERVQSELNCLLAYADGSFWLRTAWHAGLLEYWLPSATESSLRQLEALDRLPSACALRRDRSWAQLTSLLLQPLEFSRNSLHPRTQLTLAKLACLVDADPLLAEAHMQRLKYSRHETRAVGLLARLCSQIQSASVSTRAQYFIFQEIKELFPALAALGLIQGRPNWLEAPEQLNHLVLKLIDAYLTPTNPVAHPQVLVTGKDLIQKLGLKPGPIIGELLTEIQVAQAEGKVRQKAEAIEFARRLYEFRG